MSVHLHFQSHFTVHDDHYLWDFMIYPQCSFPKGCCNYIGMVLLLVSHNYFSITPINTYDGSKTSLMESFKNSLVMLLGVPLL